MMTSSRQKTMTRIDTMRWCMWSWYRRFIFMMVCLTALSPAPATSFGFQSLSMLSGFKCSHEIDMVLALDDTANVGEDAFKGQIQLALDVLNELQAQFPASSRLSIRQLDKETIPFTNVHDGNIQNQISRLSSAGSSKAIALSGVIEGAVSNFESKGSGVAARFLVVVSSTYPSAGSDLDAAMKQVRGAITGSAGVPIAFIGLGLNPEESKSMKTLASGDDKFAVSSDSKEMSSTEAADVAKQLVTLSCVSIWSLQPQCIVADGKTSVRILGSNLFGMAGESVSCRVNFVSDKDKSHNYQDVLSASPVSSDVSLETGDAVECMPKQHGDDEGLASISVSRDRRFFTSKLSLHIVNHLDHCPSNHLLAWAIAALVVLCVSGGAVAFYFWFKKTNPEHRAFQRDEYHPLLSGNEPSSTDSNTAETLQSLREGSQRSRHIIEEKAAASRPTRAKSVIEPRSVARQTQTASPISAKRGSAHVLVQHFEAMNAQLPIPSGRPSVSQRVFDHDIKASDKYVWPNQGGSASPMRVKWGQEAPPSAPIAGTEKDSAWMDESDAKTNI